MTTQPQPLLQTTTVGLCIHLAAIVSIVGADEIHFRRHIINTDSQFSACAAIDVNRDGRLDIVSGGYWYAAPDWKRHDTHNVELIRGRFDDYSNLPLDVNRDGKLDVISVNYRSRSLYWVQQPKNVGDVWTRRIIDTPGPSETGRLYDIDGDGDLDVLPNGTDYAAWYELADASDDGNASAPRWLRHELPREVVGHGIGFGDVDGDGRGDVVTSKGWFHAPADRHSGRWRFINEFRLHRDGSIPILVHDFDEDGDNDLVWGRGHDFGIYWLEQQTQEAGERTWQFHAIDTSWSCAHSLMLADVNGDGRQDVIAGKRFMGHDGKDPGEYDRLAIYWYEYLPKFSSWKRRVISRGNRCGFDLDPKCIDIDADGDLDVLAAARCGLFLLENMGPVRSSDAAEEPPSTVPQYPDHGDLTHYVDGNQRRKIESPFDWAIRREHVLLGMQAAMGNFPDPERRVPLDVRIVSEEDAGAYVRRKIVYRPELGDDVPAYLLIPKKLQAPTPAILCLHPTHALGKAQICGLGGDPTRFYAHELAERGYVCLAPDYPSFGDYDCDFSKDRYDSGTMKAIWNNVRAIDLLEAMPEVHRDRIACIGHSLGGHNALFTAAFDRRIRAIVTSCGFNAFEDYYEGDLTGWSSDRYMPRVKGQYGTDPKGMPFDFHEVLAAMAPRPLFISAPLHDDNFAVVGVRKAVESARGVYRLRGREQNLQVIHPDVGHDMPENVRLEIYQWLDGQLKQ